MNWTIREELAVLESAISDATRTDNRSRRYRKALDRIRSMLDIPPLVDQIYFDDGFEESSGDAVGQDGKFYQAKPPAEFVPLRDLPTLPKCDLIAVHRVAEFSKLETTIWKWDGKGWWLHRPGVTRSEEFLRDLSKLCDVYLVAPVTLPKGIEL